MRFDFKLSASTIIICQNPLHRREISYCWSNLSFDNPSALLKVLYFVGWLFETMLVTGIWPSEPKRPWPCDKRQLGKRLFIATRPQILTQVSKSKTKITLSSSRNKKIKFVFSFLFICYCFTLMMITQIGQSRISLLLVPKDMGLMHWLSSFLNMKSINKIY